MPFHIQRVGKIATITFERAHPTREDAERAIQRIKDTKLPAMSLVRYEIVESK